MKALGLSNYHLGIIALYVLITPLFFVFIPGALHYSFNFDNSSAVVATLVCTILIFFGVLWHRGMVARHFELNATRVGLVLIYSFIFAIPEEILFRGVIQSLLQTHLENIIIVVLLSSCVFGLAHLPNGATNLHPSGWSWEFAGFTFLAGLPLGLLFALTHSLLLPTLLHAFFLLCLQLFAQNKARDPQVV